MKHTYLVVAFALLFSTSLYSQKVLTTNSGQRILLVDDGSWRIIAETESIDDTSSELGTSLESFKSPKQGKYPVSSDQREEIKKLLTNNLSDEAQLIVNIEMAKRKLDQLKKEKSEVKKDNEKSEKIKYQIELTKIDIKADEKFYKNTSKRIELSNKLLEGKVKNIDKAFASIDLNFNTPESINSGMGGVATEVIQKEQLSTQPSPTAKAIKYPTSFELDERKRERDELDCKIVFDGYDSEIGADRKEVETQPFFSFSQDKMKPYFKTADFLNCTANISKVDKRYYLTLNIKIRSKDASKSYGMLSANENIKLELIDGRSIYGKSIKNDTGIIESYTGNTLYTGIFQLDKSDINDLKNNYIDNIGIIWSSGYEQYDIYNVDFLTNQIKCLNQ